MAKVLVEKDILQLLEQYTITNVTLKNFPRESRLLYTITQALLTNPSIQTVQHVLKVGVFTNRVLLMEHLHINLSKVPDLKL